MTKSGSRNYRIKLIGKRGRIKIWRVDGTAIRNELDVNFPNAGQHYKFSYIPKYEFWIDKEAVENDTKFLIDHLLVEWKLMRCGMKYEDALDIANAKERAERQKSKKYQAVFKKKKVFLRGDIYKKVIGRTKDGVTVWLVDGFLVRSEYDPDFVEGGHDILYHYIPKDELWIDDDIYKNEYLYIVLHELYERKLMKNGLNYHLAHYNASKVEWRARSFSQGKAGKGNEFLRSELAKLGFEVDKMLHW